MKAKQVFEFGKGNNPMSTLGLGLANKVNEKAKSLNLDNWQIDDLHLIHLFIKLLKEPKFKGIPDSRKYVDYLLNTPEYFNKINNIREREINIRSYWYDIVAYMCYFNTYFTGFDKSENKYENSDIDWAINKAVESKQDIFDLTTTMQELCITYLIDFHQNNQ